MLSSYLQAKFEFHHGDYEKQCLHALGRKDKAGMVMNNPTQSVFLFMDRQHLQVSESSENKKLPLGGTVHMKNWSFQITLFRVHSVTDA